MRRARPVVSVASFGFQYILRQPQPSESAQRGAGLKRVPSRTSLLILLFATVGAAQSVSVPTPTTLNVSIPTISSSEPVELTTHETISLSSGAVSFSLPIVSLPQRGGQTLKIGFIVSGNQYALKEVTNQFVTGPSEGGEIMPTQIGIQNAQPLSLPWGTTIHPNLPTLTADSSYAGFDTNEYSQMPPAWVTSPEYCMQNWTFTDWDGVAHSFPGTRDCSFGHGQYFSFSESFPLATVSVISNDESNYVLDASSTNDIHVIKRDGTVYHFGGYIHEPVYNNCGNCSNSQDGTELQRYNSTFSTIVDSNGNVITGPSSATNYDLIDTIGRHVTVTNNQITYKAENGQAGPGSLTTQASASVAQIPTATNMVAWPISYGSNGPCMAEPWTRDIPEEHDGFPTQVNVNYLGPGLSNGATYPAQTSYSITIPNGSASPSVYTLTFDVTGNIAKVQYPSGGYTKYDYLYGRIVEPQSFGDVQCQIPSNELLAKHECALANGTCVPAQAASATNPCVAGSPTGGEATSCYSGLFSAVPTSGGGGTVAKVTDPAGNVSIHTSGGNRIMPGNGPATYLPFYRISDSYYSGSSSLLKSVANSFSDSSTGCLSTTGPWMLQPCDVTTTYAVGTSTLSETVTMQYQAPYNPTQIKEYDFSNNLLKTTNAIWKSGGIYSSGFTTSNTNVESGPVGVTTLSNMLDHLQSLTITDAVTGNSNTKAFTYDAKGNLQQSSVSGTGVSALSTLYTPLDSFGRPTQVTDPNSNVTKYSYADSWYDSTCAPSSNSLAYLTSVTNAFSQVTTYKWNSCTGQLGSVTDANGQTTSFVYDELGRTTQIAYPDKGGATASYTDTVPNSIQISKLQSTGHSVVSNTVLDGFSRSIESQLVSDPTGTVYTDTTYDALGRVASTSNPYRSGPIAETSYFYDALGRKTLETQPDGAQLEWCYDGINDPQHPASNCHSNGTSYAGTWIDSLDEAGNNTQSSYDPNGQVRGVAEANSAQTSYGYDGVGNLLSVSQAGLSGDTARGRSFVYDALSRLKSATNPETGTIVYSYLNSGSLCAGNSSLPCSKTDARGAVTSYSYDALSRPLSKAYSGTATSTLPTQYTYDNAAISNGIGRLATEYTGSASAPTTKTAVLSYDAMGRIAEQTTIAPTASSTVYANYDLAGNQISLTYPDGRVVQHSYELSGRQQSVAYALWNTIPVGQSLFSETNGYDAAGHLFSASFGNGVPYGAGYDNRERMTTLTYGPSTAPAWSKQLAWTPNSNLQSQTDLITGVQRQFNYDSLNRLTAAQDIYSNLAVASGSNDQTTSTASSGSGAEETPGTTGAEPEWTDPNNSNLLTDVGESSSSWTLGSVTYVNNSALAPDGTMTATTLTSTAANGYLDGYVTSPSSYAKETMMGSVWIRTAGPATSVAIAILGTGPNGVQVEGGASKTVQVTSAWQQVSVTGGTQNSLTTLQLQIGSIASGQQIQIWHPMLEDEGAAGSSVTNFLPYSQLPTASSWGGAHYSVTASAATAPDGSQTVSTATATAGSTGSYITDGVANPAPFDQQAVLVSVYLEVQSGTLPVVVSILENTGGSTSVCGQTSVTLTTNWQRIPVSCTAQNTLSTLYLQIGGASFVNGASFQLWGAQMQLASSMGPYVPTAAIPVTAGTTLTNLLAYSQEMTATSWGSNTVAMSPDVVAAPDASMTATRVTAQSADSYVWDSTPNSALYGGATVTGSVYLKSESGAQTVNLYVYSVTSAGKQYLSTVQASLNSTWQRFHVTGTLPTSITGLVIQVGGSGSFPTGAVYDIWGAQIEIATYAGPYAATSALAIITGSEPSNILPNSQSLNGPSWFAVPMQAGVNVNSAAAPDGTTTAVVLACCAPVLGEPWINSGPAFLVARVPNPSLYDGETVTASVYLRSPSGAPLTNTIYIEQTGDNGADSSYSQQVSLSTKWQRFSVTAPLQNGLTSLYFQFGSVPSGQTMEVWGAQWVVGSKPDAYIPTQSGTTVYSTGQAGTLVPTGLNQSYAYDSFGNILQNGGFSISYTANNQMFGYAYDASGNLISDGFNTMTWDAESRMSSAGGATYIYDADGNRVEKQGSTVTDTVYFGGQPIARYSGGQWTDLIYGPTGLLAEVPGTQTGAPIYRVTDNLGTSVGSLLANGTFVNPVDHTPFGQVFTGNTSDPYLFTGKERDTESGLDYFGARYYASNMGRWMSPDWSDEDDPVPYADEENPQTLNLYGYVTNNPLRIYDPTGHDGVCDVLPCPTAEDIALINAAGRGGMFLLRAGTGATVGAAGLILSQIFAPAQLGKDPAEQRFLKMQHGTNNVSNEFSTYTDKELEDAYNNPKTSASDRKKIKAEQKSRATRRSRQSGGKKPPAPPVKNDPLAAGRERRRANANPVPAPDPPAPDPPKPPKDDHGDHS